MLNRELTDEILLLRLANPPANALSPDLIVALRDAVRDASDTGARGILLCGAEGMFSAGLDVPRLLQLDRHGISDFWTIFFDLLRVLGTGPIPICAAVTGHAIAGGTVLALFCDRRVAATGRFKLGINEVRVGLPLPVMIHDALAFAVGSREAQQLAITGALISPEEAAAIGLVDELAAPPEVEQRGRAWLSDLLAHPRRAMTDTRKKAREPIHRAFDMLDADYIEHMVEVWFSDETQASLRALAERLARRR